MDQQAPNLLGSTLTLPCGAVVPNRLCKAAMTEGLADEDNRATDRHAVLYKRWAEGGAGILLTGNIQVDRRYLERPGNIVIEGQQDADRMARLGKFAEAGTSAGNHLWVQIGHAGRQTPASVAKEPVGPSAVKLKLPGGAFGMPRALTGDEIRDVITRFAFVAETVKSAGFSGVQVHAAHGYLISEFLSPIANQRTDEWGGSPENRARLLLETVRATRKAVGPDFPVSVKLNSSDFQKGGFTLADCLQVVDWLNEEGLDLLEISGGNYEQPALLGAEGLEPVFVEGERQSTREREAYFMQYAAEIKNVAKMPLMVTGGFRSRDAMNAALSGDDIAVIGIGRPLCVDPETPKKLISGELSTARAWEKELRIGPGIFGPTSSISLFRLLNVQGTQSWFYENIFRLADGLEADEKMGVFRAFLRNQSHEQKAAKALTPR